MQVIVSKFLRRHLNYMHQNWEIAWLFCFFKLCINQCRLTACSVYYSRWKCTSCHLINFNLVGFHVSDPLTGCGCGRMGAVVPWVSHQGNVLWSSLTVPAHQQFEGKIVVGVLSGRGCPSLSLPHNLHLHILQSGVVHHHKALLAACRQSLVHIYFSFHYSFSSLVTTSIDIHRNNVTIIFVTHYSAAKLI